MPGRLTRGLHFNVNQFVSVSHERSSNRGQIGDVSTGNACAVGIQDSPMQTFCVRSSDIVSLNSCPADRDFCRFLSVLLVDRITVNHW